MIGTERVLKLKGYALEKAREEIVYVESLSTFERAQRTEDLKSRIVKHHLKVNPLYKRLVRQAPSQWSDLPIIQKSDLQRPLPEVVSSGIEKGQLYMSNTSGSSGHPFFFAKDKYAHALTWAFILEHYRKLNIDTGDLQARFYGIPLDSISYWKELLKDFLLKRVRFPVFDMGDENLERFLGVFRKRKIKFVYGYTNSIVLFSKFLIKKGVLLKDICPMLSLCIVTSEVCIEEDRFLIQQAFGVPVYREYGASELDVIAIEDQRGRWSVNESNLYIEVLSEDGKVLPAGEEGRLVITSLHNKAMPFIRYDIGDIGVLDEDANGLMIKKLSGRVNDTILLPSGKKSPGLTFYYVSRSILESSGVLKEFIIRQTAVDSFEFDMVSGRALDEHEIRDIRAKMNQYLEPGLKLTINRVDKISRPASGKIKHFYSEISQ